MNPHSARLETTSAKLLLWEVFFILSFSVKVILKANCCLSSLALYIAGKSISGGKHLIGIKSVRIHDLFFSDFMYFS